MDLMRGKDASRHDGDNVAVSPVMPHSGTFRAVPERRCPILKSVIRGAEFGIEKSVLRRSLEERSPGRGT